MNNIITKSPNCYSVNNFTNRVNQHDKIAIDFVENIFTKYGLITYLIGTEFDIKGLSESLRKQSDVISIMLRFRPDRVSIVIGSYSILCEIKSESGKYSNFAIEADSYKSALIWNSCDKNNKNIVVFILVDISLMSAKAIWAGQIPEPKIIYIPKRNDYIEQEIRIKKEFPNAIIKLLPYKYGSGTPYMLLPKNYKQLFDLDFFIQNEIIGVR